MVEGLFSRVATPGSKGEIVAADGERCVFEVFGTGAVAVVFVHGGLCDRSFWWRQTADIAMRFQMVTLDLVGHGASGRCRAIWSLEQLGRDVAAVVEALDVRSVVLVGHSLGALTILEAARQLPPGKVIGVVVVDMLHHPGGPSRGPPLGALDDVTALRAGMQRGMFKPTSDPVLRDTILDSMLSTAPGTAGALRSAAAAWDERVGVRAISHIPLSVILSELRPAAPDVIRSLHATSRIVVMVDTGHFPMLEAPSVFNPLLINEILRMEGAVKIL